MSEDNKSEPQQGAEAAKPDQSDFEDSKRRRVSRYRRHGARYRARRRAADILYEAENRDVDPVSIVEDRVQLAREEVHNVAPIAEYTRTIIEGAAAELDEIDEMIARFLSEDWELHRIPAVDRAILRVSAWEILFNDDVPIATSVVDGVELASEYSNDVAAPYIHAVLDDIAQYRAEGSPFQAAQDDSDDDVLGEDLSLEAGWDSSSEQSEESSSEQ